MGATCQGGYAYLKTVHLKLMIQPYIKSPIVHMCFFDYMSTILLLECFIKQACESHFITRLDNTEKLKDNKG